MFKIYVDDSGSMDYKTPFSKEFIHKPPPFDRYEDFWRNNYFVLTGVRIAKYYQNQLNDTVNKIKKKYFGTHDVEIKSDWLRNPKRRKKFYLKPFGLKTEEVDKFGLEIFDFIEKEREYLQVLAVVFDKRYFGDAKRNSPDGNILAKSTQILLERIQYLDSPHEVVFDQMMSTLRLTGKHKQILEVWKNTSGFKQIHVKDFDQIDGITFKKSYSENFLQIADICAYTIYRQFVHHGRQWQESTNDNLDTYEYFDKIRCNFINLNGKVAGVGLVCIPDKKKIDWNVFEGCELRA